MTTITTKIEKTYNLSMSENEFLALCTMLGNMSRADYEKHCDTEADVEVLDKFYSQLFEFVKKEF